MFQKEDVYETTDLPEADQAVQSRFDLNPYIERINLDVNSAFSKFKGRVISADNVDFSDSIVHARRRGYGGGQYVLEMLGPEYESNEAETLEQKYTRLFHEVNELARHLEEEKSSEKSTDSKIVEGLDAKSVSALREHLKSLHIDGVLGGADASTLEQMHISKQLSSAIDKLTFKDAEQAGDAGSAAGSKQLSYELFLPAAKVAGRDPAKLNELETRLKKIEAAVGLDSDKLAALTAGLPANSGIVDAANRIQDQMKFLAQPTFDALETRTALLLQQLEKKREVESQEGKSDQTAEKVNDLYELMKKWDGLCGSLPQIVDRLASLSSLHNQAIQFNESFNHLDATQQHLSKALEQDSDMLKKVESSLSNNMIQISANIEKIEERISKLKL